MYPDQNQNQQPYSIDYLNEIAPKDQKPGMSNKLFLMVVGGGLLLAIIVGILVFTSGGGGPKRDMQTLAARMQTLQAISNEMHDNIKSNDLRSINSSLSIFLTNANREITEPLKNNGINPEKMDKKVTAKEAASGEELKKTLEDARLNAVFDRVYAREMAFQLETVAILMAKIYEDTNSKSMKTFLEGTSGNIEPIRKQLAEFNAASA